MNIFLLLLSYSVVEFDEYFFYSYSVTLLLNSINIFFTLTQLLLLSYSVVEFDKHFFHLDSE